jgi:hypothetical protein
MIFHKILGGSDLTFDLSLDKKEYRPGENVKATLSVKAQKSVKARQLMLFAQGTESTVITVSESNNASSSRHRATRVYGGGTSMNRNQTNRTYTEVNAFFSQDLSYLLQNSIHYNTLQDGTLEILPQENEIAFCFTLPSQENLFSSYKGKHAEITYIVKATADIANKLDVNKEERFLVVNPNNNKVRSNDKNNQNHADYYNLSQEDGNNDIIDSYAFEEQKDTTPTSNLNEEPNEQEQTGRERYSERFEKIFGKEVDENALSASRQQRRYYTVRDTIRGTSINIDLGTIFAKDRDHFLKENPNAKIDLFDAQKNTAYTRRDKITGEVILLLPPNSEETIENRHIDRMKKIRGMKITLMGIENAFAQGLQRTNTIEKYEENIALNRYPTDQSAEKKDISIPFEFQIPGVINHSYVGKYSEYFWGLEAKVNIAWSSDITARTIIDITG